MHPVSTCLVALLLSLALIAPARADFVYALSYNNGRVIRYQTADPSGTVTELLAGGLLNAAGLALGSDGNLYLGESGDGGTVPPSIRRLNLATNALTTVHTFGSFDVFPDVFPGALVFRGTDLLVGRNPFFGNTGPIVSVANATGGTITIGEFTTGGSLASSPGLAFGPDGSLYVSDQTYNFVTATASGPVKRFNAAGIFVEEVIASGTSNLAGPTGLAIIGNTLFTASIMNGQVLRTDLLDDTTANFGSVIGLFQTSPLAPLSDGGLVVGSAGGAGAIYRLDATGQLVGTFNSGLGTIGGLVVAPVPEPASVVTAAAGLAAVAAWLRRRRGRA
ncbi:MAG: PEP-CTERM sorting domain-containing protein [Pirellulales bacterium]